MAHEYHCKVVVPMWNKKLRVTHCRWLITCKDFEMQGVGKVFEGLSSFASCNDLFICGEKQEEKSKEL